MLKLWPTQFDMFGNIRLGEDFLVKENVAKLLLVSM